MKKEISIFCANNFTAIVNFLGTRENGRGDSGENCFRRRLNQRKIFLAGDGLAVDLPEGGVLLNEIEAALTEGPDVHQPLDEGEQQCR